MQNTERQKFEENWKSAFDGAEATPSDRVWNSIELDLAGQESAAMKKRVVFYQRLAAATILFALLSGVYAFYPRDSDNEKQLVVKKEAATEGRSQETGVRSEEGLRPSASKPVSRLKSVASNEPIPVKEQQQQTLSEESVSEIVSDSLNESVAIADTQIEVAAPPRLEEDTKKEETKKEELVSPLIQLLEQPEEIVEPKKKKSRENNLWLAVGGAAGNYAPNTPTTNMQAADRTAFAFGPMNADAVATPKSEPKIGTSYSVGMAVGKKFGRIVVQTGINLNKQQIEYSSNYDTRTSNNTAKASSMDYLDVSSESVYTNTNADVMTVTSTYTVNSTMEVVSIPVQAGYMIIDRKLGWQINAGVSPDFFLKNILVDKSGQRERFTQAAGSESPYRSINWSGLMNTELSYRIGDHYRLSVVPGVRYSFNSILKEPTDNGRPLILDVGFRFKYLFD